MMLRSRRTGARESAPTFTNFRAALSLFALAFLLGCGAAASGAQGERFAGQWLVEYRPGTDKVNLTLSYREERTDAKGGRHYSNWNNSDNFDPSVLQGLTREQAFSSSGTNGLHETDRRPLDVCPECMAKICWATNTSPRERYERLARFCAANGLERERRFFEASAEALKKI